MDFNERAIPGISANYLIQESLARYYFVKNNLKKNSKTLEVGFGTGFGSALLAQVSKITAIDKDPEALKHALKGYGRKVLFKLGNAERLEFESLEFDTVVCFETIEHLKRPDRFLSEVKRVLKKKGKFYVSTPNKTVHSPNFVESPYHLKEYEYQEFKRILSKFFRKVEIYGQHKSNKASEALENYLKSQEARQTFVNTDVLNLRKLVPRMLKEKLWKYLGAIFGRSPQERLSFKDFPINKKIVPQAEYFLAVCQN